MAERRIGFPTMCGLQLNSTYSSNVRNVPVFGYQAPPDRPQPRDIATRTTSLDANENRGSARPYAPPTSGAEQMPGMLRTYALFATNLSQSMSHWVFALFQASVALPPRLLLGVADHSMSLALSRLMSTTSPWLRFFLCLLNFNLPNINNIFSALSNTRGGPTDEVAQQATKHVASLFVKDVKGKRTRKT